MRNKIAVCFVDRNEMVRFSQGIARTYAHPTVKHEKTFAAKICVTTAL